MESIFRMCKTLITLDKKNGTNKMTMAKLDVYLANDRLTVDEYNTLVDMMVSEQSLRRGVVMPLFFYLRRYFYEY